MNVFILIFAAIMAVLLSGCGTEEKLKEVENTYEAQQGRKPELNANVEIKEQNALIRVTTDMDISADMYGKEKKEGQGHIHMYLDDGEKQAITAVPIVLKDLAPGTHSVRLSLHNNDHTPYAITKTLTFEIK